MSTLDNLRKEAKHWLKALRAGDASADARLRKAWPAAPPEPGLRDVQHALAREHGFESWTAFKSAAAVRSRDSTPASSTFEQFDDLARDIVLAHDTGDPAAMARVLRQFGADATWKELREGVARRLATLPPEDVPAGPFELAHARLIVARHAGVRTWDELGDLLASGGARAARLTPILPPDEPDLGPGMIEPVEIRANLRVKMRDGRYTTTTDVWRMLTACRNGDLGRVRELHGTGPLMILCDYNYMAPLHLAVREGHLDIVQYLCEHGAANPNYVTYPYRESLITVARDRGHEEIARTLERWYLREDRQRPEEEGGDFEYDRDEEQVRFERLVNAGAPAEAEAMLKQRPELALDPFAFWSEGILSMPANRGNRRMLELLLRYGATVPQITKWGAWYYFKRYEIAAFLMDRGMSPHHMNCHHTTLLHDMAYTGDVRKAALLLNHGAEIDAIDEEFRSTPLGLAARFGQRDMVEFLLDRGADPNTAGAPWALPLEWAKKKAHAGIESLLRSAGARAGRTVRPPTVDDTQEAPAFAEIGAAFQSGDPDVLDDALAKHRAFVQAHRPGWLTVDARTLLARAHPQRHLPVRPDRVAIEREVEEAGGDDAARDTVARSYGVESWERLELAVRLIDAIWRDDLSTVREIVTKHPPLLHEDALIRTNSNWGPPMTYAANLGRNRIIGMLLELGAKDLGWAMGRAILQGQIDTARMLHQLGARIPDGNAFEGPAETLNAQGMALLVELGVEITTENAPVGLVLQTYCRNPGGKHQILELFVRHGIHLPDTAPMAVHRGRIDLLEGHLRRDPDLLTRTFTHREMFPPEVGCHEDETFALHGTPLGGSGLLNMCIEYDEMELAAWMIERGADVNLKARVDGEGFGGHTPLFNTVVSMAGGRPRHGEFARLLLARGADPHVRASLRKAVRFSDDESVHEYRGVTVVEWGERFHVRGLVNEAAMRLIAGRM